MIDGDLIGDLIDVFEGSANKKSMWRVEPSSKVTGKRLRSTLAQLKLLPAFR
jgi:hypothetical protein